MNLYFQVSPLLNLKALVTIQGFLSEIFLLKYSKKQTYFTETFVFREKKKSNV